ncbi:DUF4270 family protein [Chryseobacterium caseinilyticum]|uniref:DUF4270 domain-containing protein n=1 Tax=Chryseobacterium caseinilyticum TaxID=2771428 RepID=A0ABR8ZAV9_9FLAO|nr:DUF4270 family protein [Chryseobacterium caseinilyticum]MBD8082445.1 DUF4270 domain-containing protein [Chryseobacterium caseinilyticum]
MINNIKRAFAVLSLMIFGSAVLYNCEPEIDSLGEQLFLNDGTNGNEVSYDLIAYNIDNKDMVRADYSTLGSAVIGAFNEPQFGRQEASYFTQIRMSAYDPDFGTNAVVDSVVMVLKPVIPQISDSIVTTTNESYVYPDGNVDAKLELKTIPVTKYGRTKTAGNITPLTLKVQEVTEFMGSYTDSIFSNKDFEAGVVLGSKVFNGLAKSVTITKDSDNSILFPSTTNDIRISLDKTFFQNKIIAKKGQPELKDMSAFIRYFRGIKVSIQENDGYLFSVNPNDAGTQVIMYYKYDKTENGTTTPTRTSYNFNLGAGNAHSSYVKYQRAAPFIANVLGNQTVGDAKLFTQGMGGPSIGVKFKPQVIQDLREKFKNKKTAIITAKIRLYTDSLSWNNSLLKPSQLAIVQRYKSTKGEIVSSFTSDLTTFTGAPDFAYVKAFNLDKNPAYYDFTVTKSLKDIVEDIDQKDFSDKFFKIDLAQFLPGSDGVPFAGYKLTTRPFARERMVFVGSDPLNKRKIQLKLVYGSK